MSTGSGIVYTCLPPKSIASPKTAPTNSKTGSVKNPSTTRMAVRTTVQELIPIISLNPNIVIDLSFALVGCLGRVRHRLSQATPSSLASTKYPADIARYPIRFACKGRGFPLNVCDGSGLRRSLEVLLLDIKDLLRVNEPSSLYFPGRHARCQNDEARLSVIELVPDPKNNLAIRCS